MPIHHATIKKAAALDISLVEEDTGDGFVYTAHHSGFRPGYKVVAYAAPEALEAAIRMIVISAEYPALRLEYEEEWQLHHDSEEEPIATFDHVPTVAEILEACEEAGVDPEEAGDSGDDDEEERHGSVVSIRYKIEYAERGDRNNCGDWLAKTLAGQFDDVVDGKIKFNTEAFTQTLQDNGVDMSGKWAQVVYGAQTGWQGRYRMNGRQKLEIQVLLNGSLLLGGKHVVPPSEYLDYLRSKHPKYVAGAEGSNVA